MERDPNDDFPQKNLFLVQNFRSVSRYTEYTHNEQSLHPISSIKQNFVLGCPFDQANSFHSKKFKINDLRNLMSVWTLSLKAF